MSFNEGMSPADLAAVTGNNDGMFGGNGAWWIIILFLFAWAGGWGGNGYGNGSQGAANNYVLASDFATIQRQLSDGFGGVEKGIDTVRNGLCDGFYTTAQQFNTTNTNVLQGFNATQAAIKDCCCQTQQNIKDTQYVIGSNVADLKYTIAQGNCALGNQMQMSTRDITDNANANTKAILDFLVNDKMSTLQRENDSLRLAASQAAQNNYLIGALRPAPVPAYAVPNPYCNCNCSC